MGLGIAERRSRERADREVRIVEAAREIAERDGWNAVTVRRLADEVEYSQPVLYSHFENRDAIVAAVALEGFRDFTAMLHDAGARASGAYAADDAAALANVANAYFDFASKNPAVYEAMFTLRTELRFADPETKPELRAAFAVLVSVVEPFCEDAQTATETFWAALHGLVELERSGRVRVSARAERILLVVQGITTPPRKRARNSAR